MATILALPTELLEDVLVKLSHKQIFALRRVCTVFKDVIIGSPIIRRKLFLAAQVQPWSSDNPVETNPFLNSLGAWYTTSTVTFPIVTFSRRRIRWCSQGYDIHISCSEDLSCLKILLSRLHGNQIRRHPPQKLKQDDTHMDMLLSQPNLPAKVWVKNGIQKSEMVGKVPAGATFRDVTDMVWKSRHERLGRGIRRY